MTERRAIFLDRDGVLIRTFVRDGVPHPPSSLDEVEILLGVPAALAALKQRGFLLLVVTNQPDVARGSQSRARVDAINARLARELPLDGVYVCYHDTPDRCGCRKPAPGLLLDAAAEHGVDLADSYMAGDRASDIAAGQAAGCRTILLRHPYSGSCHIKPTFEVADLVEAAHCVLHDQDA